MNRKFDWSPLTHVGAFVVVPGADARRVGLLASQYLRRRLGTEVVLATRSTPAGAFVAVAYMPEAPTEVVEDPAPTPATPTTPVYTGPTTAYDHPYDDSDEPEDEGADDEDVGSPSKGGGYSLEDDE